MYAVFRGDIAPCCFLEQFSFLPECTVYFIEIISLVVILLLAPMDSAAKHLDEQEIKKFRNLSRFILVFEFLILLGQYILNAGY